MRPIDTDRVAWSVGRSVTIVSPGKTAQPIEMSFGLQAWMGPRNHVLDRIHLGTWGPDRAICRGHDMLGHARRHSAVSWAKTVEPMEM